MKKKALRVILLSVLFALAAPLTGLAETCSSSVFRDVYPEGYFLCAENAYPYYLNPYDTDTDPIPDAPQSGGQPETRDGGRLGDAQGRGR